MDGSADKLSKGQPIKRVIEAFCAVRAICCVWIIRPVNDPSISYGEVITIG